MLLAAALALVAPPAVTQKVWGCGTTAISKPEAGDRMRLGSNADCFARAKAVADRMPGMPAATPGTTAQRPVRRVGAQRPGTLDGQLHREDAVLLGRRSGRRIAAGDGGRV